MAAAKTPKVKVKVMGTLRLTPVLLSIINSNRTGRATEPGLAILWSALYKAASEAK